MTNYRTSLFTAIDNFKLKITLENPRSGVVSVRINDELRGYMNLTAGELAAAELTNADDFIEINIHKDSPIDPYQN